MIEVQDLHKRFGSVHAVAGVGFRANDAGITGLLGPNGAGKSTILRILSTVISPDAGTATIGGIEVAAAPLEARRAIGVLPHGAGLYPQLTARENIAYYARLHGLRRPLLQRRVDALVERLGLEGIAERRTRGFSQGERTKVALARALVHEPRHLLLDEPTTGLDVLAARQLKSWLRELADDGCCIVLSSHLMRDVAALADNLVIVANGRVAASGQPEELATQFAHRDLEEIFLEAVDKAAR